jgi:outer membrane immunogenic protein
MLRRILLASVGAMALSGAALAADLPSYAPQPVYLPPPPVFTWTGIYLGINAGYHWGGSATQFTGAEMGTTPAFTAGLSDGVIPTTGASGASGAIAGGTIGYNWQINSFVLGLEVDIDGAGRRKTLNTVHGPDNVIPVAVFFSSSQGLDWLGTVRGRIGFTPIDRLLIYGTGGLAFGESTASFSADAPTASLSGFVSNRASVGWVAGGGVEYALPYNWSVKAEYLHYDLGRTTGTILFANRKQILSTLTGQMRQNGNILRAGLAYKFNWWSPGPVVAKY